MLLNVALSSDVLVEISGSRLGRYAESVQKQLRLALDKHGVLMQPSVDERQRLLELLRGDQLTPAEQKNWKSVLVRLNKSGRFTTAHPSVIESWSDLDSGDQAAELMQLAPILSLVSGADFERLFPTDTNIHMVSETVEVATAACLTDSRQFSHIEELREDGAFPKGTDREIAWSRMFKPLTQVSKQVVIFDRYLFARIWERDNPFRGEPEHVVWLLEHINETIPSGGEVVLMGEAGKRPQRRTDLPQNPEVILDRLVSTLRNRFDRLGSLKFVVSSGQPRMHHDRHIRFSTGHAIEVPPGFDRFERSQLKESVSFSYRHTTKSINELIQREADAEGAHLTRVTGLKVVQPGGM